MEVSGAWHSNMSLMEWTGIVWTYEKHQAPTSKLQTSTRLRLSKRTSDTDFFSALGSWNLEFVWCLEVGAWMFVARCQLDVRTNPAALERRDPPNLRRYASVGADSDRSEERRVGKECRSRWSP